MRQLYVWVSILKEARMSVIKFPEKESASHTIWRLIRVLDELNEREDQD